VLATGANIHLYFVIMRFAPLGGNKDSYQAIPIRTDKTGQIPFPPKGGKGTGLLSCRSFRSM
jgi:hypothetical protein